MARPKDALESLERQRLKLEENISQLQQQLYRWRLWDAEYDALKDEITSLGEGSTREDVLRTGREFGGSLVTEDEVKVLLGDNQGVIRSREQIVANIARRIDYVRQNIFTLEKQLAAAEDKLNVILVIEQPSNINEEGLPITDIVEELDDEGHVINSSTRTAGQAAPELLDVLKKAGVDVPERGDGDKGLHAGKKDMGALQMAPEDGMDIDKPSPSEGLPESTGSTSGVSQIMPPTDDAIATSSVTDSSVSQASNVTTRGSPPVITSDEDTEDDSTMMTEIDESPEDAALRREILQYGLEEVGAVVAELEMDESGSEFSISDEEYLMTDDEEEDEYGRTTRRVLDEEYHKQMRELEQNLNAKVLRNIGPDPSKLPDEVQRELEGSKAVLEIAEPEVVVSDKVDEKPAKKKKKVAFADELDIAPDRATKAASSDVEAKPERKVETPTVPAIQEAIVERSQAKKEEAQDTTQPAPPKKVSRFRSARKSAEPGGNTLQSFPSFPNEHKPHPSTQAPSSIPLFPAKPSTPKPFSQPIIDLTDPSHSSSQQSTSSRQPQAPPTPLSGTLIERTPPSPTTNTIPLPPLPSDVDEELHSREIASEFYQLRNRKIQQEGGFLRDDGEEMEAVVPLDEDGQEMPRVSRFKAARARRGV
ncbi:hypothetical protein AJ80_00273 [Polytolypa hystricis UAMH7299]|uniref:DUF3835 domain-containing protein n=1 Tax=Polytolypa hystricis (strain UAMH7299) TaxID=1447883 RepID=A0A2B7Z4H0_POLH7|nr:hypothetical protein AJ80_00273 [Polytolypa hystricis UAMH7299]